MMDRHSTSKSPSASSSMCKVAGTKSATQAAALSKGKKKADAEREVVAANVKRPAA